MARVNDIDKIRSKFHQLDKDGDGTLSFKEMKRLLKGLNSGFSEHQLQQLYCEIDSNQNGIVEIDEFVDFMATGKRSTPAKTRVPPKGGSNPDGISDEWKQATLDGHNALRAVHGSAPLQWSDECYIEAKKAANAAQAKGSLFHSHLEGPSGRHGQNAYWSSAAGARAQQCCQGWYDEIDDPGYDFEKPTGFSMGTGHFTAVVWTDTTHVGMAVSECGCFTFANYLPAGNMMGQFEQKVPPRGGFDGGGAPPPARPESPRPEPGGGGGDGDGSVSASEMTPELEAAFAGCPFPFKDEAEGAFSRGGGPVTVQRSKEGRMTKMVVTIKEGCCTSEMRGSWGGG